MADTTSTEQSTTRKEPVEFSASFQGKHSLYDFKLTIPDFYAELKKQLDLTFSGLRY